MSSAFMTVRRRPGTVLVAVAVVLFLAQAAAFNDARLDDAYITFRYSQNLATSHGFVFNPGERILGTTSPGHALVGALLYLAAGKVGLPPLMSVLGCLGWTVQAACVYALLRAPLGQLGAGGVAAAIGLGATRAYFVVPLETNVVAALVLGAFVLADARRWAACGGVAGAAAVFRPDALVACAVLGALALAADRRSAARFAAACAIVLGAWVAFASAYFGSPVPQTFWAKIAHSTVGEYAAYAFVHPAWSLVTPWHRAMSPTALLSWLVALPVWVVGAGGAIVLTRGSRVLTALAGYGVLLSLAYVAMHPDTAFEWHLYPSTLVFAIFALGGFAKLGARLPPAVAGVAGVAIVGWFTYQAVLFANETPFIPDYGARDRLCHVVAGFLGVSAAPTDVVDAEEVGTIAYLTELPMLDMAGLVSHRGLEELFEAAHGRPSPVKWAVLSPWEADVAKATFSRFRCVVFAEAPIERRVCDLRAPRP